MNCLAEKNIVIDGLNISYAEFGDFSKPHLLFLHGWRCDKSALASIYMPLVDDYFIVAPDLPGFGNSDEMQEPWDASRFADFTAEFIATVGLKDVTAIGHSNGGRILIKLCGGGYDNIKKLVLIGSSGIKPKRSIKYYFKVYSYKTGKQLLKLPFFKKPLKKMFEKTIKNAGSGDYRLVSDVLKRTMTLLLNGDLKSVMPRITQSTLLMWGEFDTANPLSNAKTMEKLIKDSGLVVFKNAGHFPFLDDKIKFMAAFKYFLNI